jgi:hypothetical protein
VVHVHVKGWAPYGSPLSAQLTQAEALVHGEALINLLPEWRRTAVRAHRPSPYSFKIGFRMETFQYETASEFMHQWNNAIKLADYEVNGCRVWVAGETTKQRQNLWNNVKLAQQQLEDHLVDKEAYILCDRLLRIYSTSTRQLLGSTPRHESNWLWTAAGCAILGISEPPVAVPLIPPPQAAATATATEPADSNMTSTPAADNHQAPA